MGVFLLRRAASSLSVLALSVVLVFMSIRILPGDPVLAKLGAATGVTPEALEALREEAGLNRPLLVQLISWIGDAFRGDLGAAGASGLDRAGARRPRSDQDAPLQRGSGESGRAARTFARGEDP